MRHYLPERSGNLLITKAAISGPSGTTVLRLLIDTGSSYTVIPVEALEAIGCSPAAALERVRIITGSGTVIVPLVRVPQLQALGERRLGWRVAAHTLPLGLPIDGLLGMDFLCAVKARIDLDDGSIEIP
jgi:aspartyl protease family protein